MRTDEGKAARYQDDAGRYKCMYVYIRHAANTVAQVATATRGDSNTGCCMLLPSLFSALHSIECREFTFHSSPHYYYYYYYMHTY